MTFEGIVDHIIFRNEENGYSVFEFSTDKAPLTVVGVFPILSEGENLRITGEMVNHSSYGEQLKASSSEVLAPSDELAMERYLGSGAIKGLGPVTAARIVRRFGKDTFRIIDEEPERLAEIKGISPKKAREIGIQMLDRKQMREAMVFLQEKGISPNLALKIYSAYGDSLYQVVATNPYQLADDIEGVGFKIADEIAMKNGFRADSEFRISSGILYALQLAMADGHIYLPVEKLTAKAAEILEVDPEWIRDVYTGLAMERKIIIDGENIYHAPSYYCEENCARMLRDLSVGYDVKDEELSRAIESIEAREKITLDDLQKDAITYAAKNGLFILTGGPGTGKTTTIRSIIAYFEGEGLEIELAAPTGRAAKRMSEATGRGARTIHRLLEVHGGADDGGSGIFERNESNPIDTDVVIIDEMSMVDIFLFNALLKAVSLGTRLILVGDANQLPSVGPGNVLRDIIDSNAFAAIRLNRIFRQEGTSDIVVNAHKIQNGEQVVADNKSKDFFLLPRYDADVITAVSLNLIKNKLPKYVNATSYDIQVLTPTRKGLLGVENLNRVLQNSLNPADGIKKEKTFGEKVFREGDKVMQIRNNYQLAWEVRNSKGFPIDSGLGVFNGDMGIVRKISAYAESLTVEFDEGRMVEYPFKLLDELEHSYAITIHKSQGSEYPAVVMPLLSGPRMLMNRNLIYTAITRAKSCVTIVGDEKVFYEMCRNTMQAERYSSLAKRITESSI